MEKKNYFEMFWLTSSEAVFSQDRVNQIKSPVLLKKRKAPEIQGHHDNSGMWRLPAGHRSWSPGCCLVTPVFLWGFQIQSAVTRNVSFHYLIAKSNGNSLLQKQHIFKREILCVLSTGVAALWSLEAFGCGTDRIQTFTERLSSH